MGRTQKLAAIIKEGVRNPQKIKKGLKVLKNQGPEIFKQRLSASVNYEPGYGRVKKEKLKNYSGEILFSIVMPVYNVEIKARQEQLKNLIKETKSDYEKEKLQERLGKISDGIGVIRVGAATETEMKEMKMRIEDALSATKAAIEEGVVIGGGVVLAKISNLISNLDLGGEENLGVSIVRNALNEPLKQIVINAGLDAEEVLEKVINGGENIGFDASNEEYVDMIEKGILDPAKVTRAAIQNAVSAGSVFITTEVAIADVKTEEKNNVMG